MLFQEDFNSNVTGEVWEHGDIPTTKWNRGWNKGSDHETVLLYYLNIII